MKKVVLALITSLLFVACGGSSGGGGGNSVSFKSDSSSFTISLKSSINPGQGDYYHVKYELRQGSGSTILSNGSNWKGKVTTTCNGAYSSGTYNAYTCTTQFDTDSPTGDPSNETKEVKLYDGETYSLYMIEYSLFGENKETHIKSFTTN